MNITRQRVVTHLNTHHVTECMKKPNWISTMWTDGEKEKLRFLRAVSDVEIAHLKKHKTSKADVHFLWLDCLLIGIEVRDGKESVVYYDTDLTSASGKTTGHK